MLSDQLSSGLGKAAAGAAVLVVGLGGAAGVHHVTTHRSAPKPAVVVPAAHKTASSPVATATATGASVTTPAAGVTERRRSG